MKMLKKILLVTPSKAIKHNLDSISPKNKKRKKSSYEDDNVASSDNKKARENLIEVGAVAAHIENQEPNNPFSKTQQFEKLSKKIPQLFVINLVNDNHPNIADNVTSNLSRSSSTASTSTTSTELLNHNLPNKKNLLGLASDTLIKNNDSYYKMTNKEKSAFKYNILARYEIVARHIQDIKNEINLLKYDIRESSLLRSDARTKALDADIELSIIINKEEKIAKLEREKTCLENEQRSLNSIKEQRGIYDTVKPAHQRSIRDGKAQPPITIFFTRKKADQGLQHSVIKL